MLKWLLCLQNPVFDASLLMTLTTGSLTGKFAADVHQLMSQYIIASGNIAYVSLP